MEQKHLDITNIENLRSAVEALLFIYGEPLPYTKLETILMIDKSTIAEAVHALANDLKEAGRGLRIVTDGSSAQLVTAPECATLVEAVAKDEFTDALTPAALETLSIIAYRGPITRAEIDFIRGVNSTFMLRSLLMRGLIERYKDQNRGGAYLYKASFDLLRALGVEKIEDLPEYEKYRDLDVTGEDDKEATAEEINVRNEAQ